MMKTLPVLIVAALAGVLPVHAAENIADALLFDSPAAQDHDEGPHVPEPLVFDLVRPLGARKGEVEFNTLGIVPLNRRIGGRSHGSDDLGMVPLSRDNAEIEWAPEIEFALADGFALEFEFPFEGSQLEALKMGAQWTLGTALDNRYIHGFQGLAERALESTTSSWTGLYLAGMRFSPRWSLLGMWGASYEAGSGVEEKGGQRTRLLQNVSLFYNVTDKTHLGLETNYAVSMHGKQTLLLMPQMQMALSKHLCVQLGAGVGFSESETLPQVGLRVIVSN